MKINKRVIFIGKTACGKTTLAQYLNSEKIEYKKTQSLEVVNRMLIDTPGEYLEQHRLKGAILTASYDAEVIVLMQSAVEDMSMFPAAFASVFAKPVIGIVSKIDIAEITEIERAVANLQKAGVSHVFKISTTHGVGLLELISYINQM